MAVDHELFEDRLPTYLTRFVGRTAELGDVVTLLRDGRLVTICGVGGAGKTRLSIEAAKRWRSAARGGEVHWVPLAEMGDPETLARSVAGALDLDWGHGKNPLAVIVDVLRDKSALLILDNCEHVVEACRMMVGQLLEACSGLTVLTTSREPLGAPGEQVFPIPPLGAGVATPGDNRELGEAADLFMDRAVSVASVYALTEANIATIGRICERLDGLPLAIELAASWIRVLSVADLLAEIEKGTDVLTSDSAPVAGRHRSMRAVLDSSWRWLGEEDRRVLAALGVFASGFSREAAEAVAGASLSTLASLIERSLIQRLPDSTGGTRYQVHELVRSYAFDRLLKSGEEGAGAVRSRHLDFFLGLAEHANAVWESPDGPDWLSRIRVDQANIDQAMWWALERLDADRALRLAASMYSYWIFTSMHTYYSTLLERALSLPQSEDHEAVRIRAEALTVAGFAAIAAGDVRLARSRFVEDLAMCERLGDPVLIGRALRGVAHSLLHLGELDAARDHIERSLVGSRSVDDRRGVAWSVHDLGELEFASGHVGMAEALLQQAMTQFSEVGNMMGTYRAEVLLGNVHTAKEDWPTALAFFGRAIDLAASMHFKVRLPIVFEGLAEIATALQRPETAARLVGAAASCREGYGFPRQPYFEAAHQRTVTRAQRQLRVQEWDENRELGAGWTLDQALQSAESVIRELTLVLDRRALGVTEREIAVLRLVGLGLSNDDIADRLSVSPRTVHAHLRSIFEKLGVSTRTAAAHEATKLNLI